MAQGAADLREYLIASRHRLTLRTARRPVWRRRSGRRQVAHEFRHTDNVADGGRWTRSCAVEMVFRDSVEDAPRRFVALVRKQIVGDALLYVICLAGEHEQRLI